MVGEPEDSTIAVIRFNYVKSSGYRTIYVDGAIGSVTPKGMIHASVFSERAAVPQLVELSVHKDGSTGPETVLEGKQGFVRQLEIGLMMDARAARNLGAWLVKQADEVERLISAQNPSK